MDISSFGWLPKEGWQQQSASQQTTYHSTIVKRMSACAKAAISAPTVGLEQQEGLQMLKVPIGSFPDDAGFDDASLLAGDNSLFGGLGNSASQMAAIRHQSRMRTPLKRCFLQKLPVKGLGTRKSCRERFAHDYFHRHR